MLLDLRKLKNNLILLSTMKIYYGRAIYNKKEINAVNKVLKNNFLNLINGPHVKLLERKITKLFGKKYALLFHLYPSFHIF